MQLQEETDKTPQFLISFKLVILCSHTCQSTPPRAGEIKTPPSIHLPLQTNKSRSESSHMLPS